MLRIDLRKPVAEPDRLNLRSNGFERPFGIVTACDPFGIEQDAAVNRMRTGMLQMEVGRMVERYVSVDACSVDGVHCEASFAIAAPLELLVALALRHDQLGIFWFDGVAFWIVPARSHNSRLRLPVRV